MLPWVHATQKLHTAVKTSMLPMVSGIQTENEHQNSNLYVSEQLNSNSLPESLTTTVREIF